MGRMEKHCIDCGSRAVNRIIDEVRPMFRMETVDFACGAVLKSTFTNNGNVARVSHSGCSRFEELVAPI